MSKTLDLLKSQGKVAAWYDFKSGSMLDKSGNGNTLVASNSPTWKNTKRGRGVSTSATTSLLHAPDAASLRLTEGVFMVFGDLTQQYTQQVFAELTAGAGTWVLFYSTNGGSMAVWDGTNASVITKTFAPAKMIATRFKSGRVADFFVDGVLVGTAAVANSFPTAPTGGLSVASISTTSGPFKNPTTDFVLLNSADVTNQQISQIYNELMAERGTGDPKTTNFHASAPVDTTGKCVLHWDMSTLTGDGKMLDRSGNGRHGTISQAQKVYSAPFDGMQFNQVLASNISLASGYTNTISGNQNAALGFWVNADELAAAPQIITNSNGTFVVELAANAIYIACSTTRTYTVTGMANSKWIHIYFEKTGSGNLGNLYVNNVLQTSYTGIISDMPTVASSMLEIGGQIGGMNYRLLGKLADLRLYTSNLTAAERTALYNDGAKRLVSRNDLKDAAVTLADVTAGTIPGTDIEVVGGTAAITQDTTGPFRKWLKSIANSTTTFLSKQAYGTWYWRFTTDGSTSDFQLMGALKGTYTLAGNTGYFVEYTATNITLYRTSGGGAYTLLMQAAAYLAASTAYELCVTRTISGVWTLYIRGGAYAAWTKIAASSGSNPVTDNTYTTSAYFSQYLLTNGRFAGFCALAGVIDPTSTPELMPN